MRPLLIALITSLCLALVATSAWAGERDKTKSRLRRGEIIVKTSPVKGSKYPKILAMALIDVPPSSLWEIIGNCDLYKDNLPNVVEAKLIKMVKKNVERCKVVVSVPLLPNLTAITDTKVKVVPNTSYIREWKLVKGDYKRNVGKWTIVPFESPDRTLAVYETHVVPKMDVPPKIQKMALRNALPGLFKLLRRRTAEREAAKRARKVKQKNAATGSR